MSEIATDTSNEEQSPRSTVLLADSITGGVMPGIMSDGSLASPDDKVDSAEKGKDTTGSQEDPLSPLPSSGGPPTGRRQPQYRESERATPTTPLPYEYSYTSYSSVTPQQQRSAYGYTTGYHLQTPEPASPATHGPIYDVNSFLQPMGAFHTGSNFLAGASPSRMTPIPPPSPLFPRASTTGSVESGHPPVLPYMSPHLGSNGVAPAAYNVSYPSHRQDSWNGSNGDGNANKAYLSPQVQSYLPQQAAARSYAFEESMLPPPAVEDHAANPAYSPYAGSQGSAYSMVSSWPYGGPGDPYSNQAAPPLQPRPSTTAGMGLYPPAGGGRGMYGQYYPSTSPGPPIQTTASNKGPDGANLFIFHIPNHFTNFDMFQLFDRYGTLLSVRIMVEKDTGRSRGFGFVSYDSPESAALAIKELNGFAIGNKRLKVQHKQIRRHDVPESAAQEGYDGGAATGYRAANDVGASYPAPPPASAAPGEMWFDTTTPVNESVPNIKPVPASPLESLGQLHDALPDIPGNTTVVENKEDVVVEPQQQPEKTVIANDICC